MIEVIASSIFVFRIYTTHPFHGYTIHHVSDYPTMHHCIGAMKRKLHQSSFAVTTLYHTYLPKTLNSDGSETTAECIYVKGGAS